MHVAAQQLTDPNGTGPKAPSIGDRGGRALADCPVWCDGTCSDDRGERFHCGTFAVVTSDLSGEQVGVDLSRSDLPTRTGLTCVDITYATCADNAIDECVSLTPGAARQFALAILAAAALAELDGRWHAKVEHR